jgi:hypothetical protein
MRRLILILRTLLYGWILAIRGLLVRGRSARRRSRRHGRDERERRISRARCLPVDHPAFVRPDPLIYSQWYLMKLGLAVTWNNPDVQLWRGGLPVSSSLLDPDTEYEVVARVWNASPDGPVVQMPVHFSYLDFGVGTTSNPIATTTIDVGVKGSASEPAFASVPWRTPAEAGHYCLQVRLDPADDSNFANNLGQENTNVGKATSPAVFTFSLRNNTSLPHRYHFAVDGYRIPTRDRCGEQESAEERRRRLERHSLPQHALAAGWEVALSPETPSLQPDQQIVVTATITPPDGWSGSQTVNVNAHHEHGPAGGVTLVVESEG